MKTPDEARQCWCPFARVIAGGKEPGETPSFNRVRDLDAPALDTNPDSARCIADDCMAWRWSDWEKIVYPAGGYDQTEPPEDVKMGFCGLAGRP